MRQIAITLPVSLLAALLSCGSPTPSPTTQTGITTLPAGAVLSSKPDGPPAVRPATNLALALETRGAATRVLAADGSFGWTTANLPAPAPVTAECPAESFVLFKESPDKISPEEGGTQPATAREGPVLGASTAVYPASQRDLLAPERFRIILPSLRVRCGVEGYAPPAWLTLRYSSPDLASVVGLVRGPFLGPFKKTMLAGAPSADSPVSAFLEDQIAQQSSGVNWTDVHAFYRDPEAAARTITVYGGGAARLYRFSTPDAMLFFPQYAPYPLRVASHNGGWLLEVVSIFGDGAYSTLFRIDPQGKITFEPLSRSSGEDDQDVEASWGLLDGKLWIARAAGTKVTLTGVSSLHLAVMGTSPGYVTPIDSSAAVFPSPAANRVEWITAIPFLTEAEAKRNAGGRTIRRYP